MFILKKLKFKQKTCIWVLIATGICNHSPQKTLKMKTTQVSLSFWRKLPIVHPYSGMPLSNKKAINNRSHHLDETTLSERSWSQRVTQGVIPQVLALREMENCKKRGLSVVCKGWVGGVSDYKGGSTQQDFLFWRKGEPPKVDLQDSAAFALATVRIGGWEGDCRERKTRTMPAIIQMKHEGGLARVVEMVREKYGQICEIYRITNQRDCLLTWRGSVQEGEGGLRDEALGSGCSHLVLWCFVLASAAGSCGPCHSFPNCSLLTGVRLPRPPWILG